MEKLLSCYKLESESVLSVFTVFRAQTNCDVFVLTKQDLDEVLSHYPQIRKKILETAEERQRMVKQRAAAFAAKKKQEEEDKKKKEEEDRLAQEEEDRKRKEEGKVGPRSAYFV